MLAVVHQGARRYGEARDRAPQLDATDVTANFWSAVSYCITGYMARCRSGLDRTLEIDPLLPNALNWRARLSLSNGDLESAERLMERALGAGMQTGHFVQFWIARKRGDPAEARAQALALTRWLRGELPPDVAALIAEGLVGDADARARAIKAIDDYLVDPLEPISNLVPGALVFIGEVDRGLTTFADYRVSFDGPFLGDFLGARLVPEVWTSPVFP